MSFSSEVKAELQKKVFTSRQKEGNISKYGTKPAALSAEKRRAYLRDCFLQCGTMSDPKKDYRLEFACDSQELAEGIRSVLSSFGIEAHESLRNGRQILYIRESEAVADFLNVTGAHKSLMEFENLRIEKGLRSDVNRRVNCDTANIRKALEAAERQIEDICLIRDECGLGSLPEGLRLVAELRLEHPEMGLNELGELLDPPVGKSGINHRLRKIGAMAEELRQRKEIQQEGPDGTGMGGTWKRQ